MKILDVEMVKLMLEYVILLGIDQKKTYKIKSHAIIVLLLFLSSLVILKEPQVESSKFPKIYIYIIVGVCLLMPFSNAIRSVFIIIKM